MAFILPRDGNELASRDMEMLNGTGDVLSWVGVALDPEEAGFEGRKENEAREEYAVVCRMGTGGRGGCPDVRAKTGHSRRERKFWFGTTSSGVLRR